MQAFLCFPFGIFYGKIKRRKGVEKVGFLDSYKRLEKLCGDVMGDPRRVSAYIEEMEGIPSGGRYVAGWRDDLRRLKHYRWVRNRIVHEPDCTEENLCTQEDEEWLAFFYDRIMDQTDPLAMYRKTTMPETAPVRTNGSPDPVTDNLRAACLLLGLAVLGFLAVLVFLVA